MKKILAIGDIHQAPNLEQIEATIARENPDRVVFVGDYFDQWHDHPDHAVRTARWLKQSLADPKRIHLLGNHDLHYLWPEAACSGFTWEKHRFIQHVLMPSDLDRLDLFHYEDGWLFTHAGLSRAYAPTEKDIFTPIQILALEVNEAWHSLWKRQPHWIWNTGENSSEKGSVGGLLWCRVGRDFVPVLGLNQVLGHTPQKQPLLIEAKNSRNWCIDTSAITGPTFALVIEAGRERVVKISD
jgi:hypothetical protein